MGIRRGVQPRAMAPCTSPQPHQRQTRLSVHANLRSEHTQGDAAIRTENTWCTGHGYTLIKAATIESFPPSQTYLVLRVTLCSCEAYGMRPQVQGTRGRHMGVRTTAAEAGAVSRDRERAREREGQVCMGFHPIQDRVTERVATLFPTHSVRYPFIRGCAVASLQSRVPATTYLSIVA